MSVIAAQIFFAGDHFLHYKLFDVKGTNTM